MFQAVAAAVAAAAAGHGDGAAVVTEQKHKSGMKKWHQIPAVIKSVKV